MRRTPRIVDLHQRFSARRRLTSLNFARSTRVLISFQRDASETFSNLGSIGRVRMRLPVTAKIAFVTAAATAAVGEAT